MLEVIIDAAYNGKKSFRIFQKDYQAYTPSISGQIQQADYNVVSTKKPHKLFIDNR